MGARQRRVAFVLVASCLQVSGAVAADAPYELSCGQALTVWRKARDPGAGDCCALVVRAKAGLWAAPARARELSSRAVTLCPHGMEAAVALALAALAVGDVAEAHRLFERLSTGKNAEIWLQLPPGQQLFAARAANLTGAVDRALDHYRAVILDLERIPSPHERARVLLEAAMMATRATPPAPAEALAYFRQSADHPSPRLGVVRQLIGHALGLEGGSGEDHALELQLEEARELLRWMQGSAVNPRGAPGELLPVLRPEVLAEFLPRDRLTEQPPFPEADSGEADP